MTDKTLQERLRAMVPHGRPFTAIERFDAEQTAKEAADALDAKDAEITRLKATCDQLQPLAEQWVSHLETAFDASDDDGAIYADWQDALSTLKAAIQALHK